MFYYTFDRIMEPILQGCVWVCFKLLLIPLLDLKRTFKEMLHTLERVVNNKRIHARKINKRTVNLFWYKIIVWER